MPKRSGIILLIIIVLPLVIYVVLRLGKHNFDKLEVLVPKKIANPDGGPDSLYHKVGDFSFPSQTGATVTQDSIKNKIVIADVFFTSCPGICPKLSANMKRLHDYFEADSEVRLLSISVDPEHDSVSVLKDYAARYEANPAKWYFLTGNKKALYEFAHKSFFFKAMEGTGGELGFIHDNTYRVVDKEGRLRGSWHYIGTEATTVDSLINDIKRLKMEYANKK